MGIALSAGNWSGAMPGGSRKLTTVGSRLDNITFGPRIRREKPEDPRKYQLAIPQAFEGIVLQMLAKRTEDRYQTVAEVLRDLERALKYQGMTL